MPDKAKRVAKFKKQSFMFTCLDGPKSPPLRTRHLFGHLDHIEANNDTYRVAGPMRKDTDGEIFGSFFIVEFRSGNLCAAILIFRQTCMRRF